jgi:uncharacterized phage-associated protein
MKAISQAILQNILQKEFEKNLKKSKIHVDKFVFFAYTMYIPNEQTKGGQTHGKDLQDGIRNSGGD